MTGFMAICLASFLLQGSPSRAAEWTVTPSISITEEYDSNVLFDRLNSFDDFVTRVTPRLQGRRDTETSRFGFNAALFGEKYVLNPELDTINGNAQGSWTRTWSPRFQTSLNALFARDQTLDTQLYETGVLTFRQDRYRYAADGAAVFALTERWSLGGSLAGQYNQYPDGPSPDLFVLQGTMTPIWQITEWDAGGIVLAFSRADYENHTLDQTVSGSLSWERKLSETNRLSLQAGYRYTMLDQEIPFSRLVLRPDGTPVIRIVTQDVSSTDGGFIFSARLDKDWTPRLTTSVSAGREHANTSETTSVDRNYLRTGTQFRFTERMSLRADLGYDYTTELGVEDEITHYFRGAPSLSYQLTPYVSLSVGCSYEYVVEDRRGDSLNRDRVRTWISLSNTWPKLWGKLGDF
jgi:hypothetical protein